MDIYERKISELIPAEYNPRYISPEAFEQLKASLQRFEAVEPAIINRHADRTDIIVGGHQRLKAATSLGWKTFPCVYVELTRDQEKELNIRLNKNTGQFDFDLLADHFNMEELTGWGFSEEELFGDGVFDEPDPEEDDYTIPEQVATDIMVGDLIEIGPHRLLCGDSTDPKQVATLMNGDLADMVMTDPPYNVDYQGGTDLKLKIKNDNMSDPQFYAFLLGFYKAFAEVTKPGGAWYVWHADTEGLNFRSAFTESGLLMKQCLIWVKNSLVMGRQDYQWQHEPCLYGWKPGAAHYFTDDRTQTTIIEDRIDLGKLKKDELRAMLQEIMDGGPASTVIRHNKPIKSAEHPTMKPIKLLAPRIQNSSKKNWIVADPFLGSGSTMVACEQLGRRCYGMELDEVYCQVVINRMLHSFPDMDIRINGEPYQAAA